MKDEKDLLSSVLIKPPVGGYSAGHWSARLTSKWLTGGLIMPFQGDKKVGKSLLQDAEGKLRDWMLPRVPRRVETYHLTLTTILWSLMIIVFSFLAKYQVHFLWLVSLMIFLQYITDMLDGAVGRQRNTGLVKWGYYMDHFLDYLFLCSILIGYAILLPDHLKYMQFFILAIFGAFMVNSFLSFSATGEFQIAYMGIGPTEIRLVFIVVNALLVICGKTHAVKALPIVLWLATFGLFVTVYRTQKKIWAIDMEAKGSAGDEN
ncbi:MAG: CDP-alcohol phosphatidyltransferase family protein [Kiritimatiellia bacterium]|nr:CDP-alcohol phosphatidyltransferase family protein [Kiritimatiellia bacterium]